jgi:hypothetical protein
MVVGSAVASSEDRLRECLVRVIAEKTWGGGFAGIRVKTPPFWWVVVVGDYEEGSVIEWILGLCVGEGKCERESDDFFNFLLLRRSLFEAEDGSQSLGFFLGGLCGVFYFYAL